MAFKLALAGTFAVMLFMQGTAQFAGFAAVHFIMCMAAAHAVDHQEKRGK